MFSLCALKFPLALMFDWKPALKIIITTDLFRTMLKIWVWLSKRSSRIRGICFSEAFMFWQSNPNQIKTFRKYKKTFVIRPLEKNRSFGVLVEFPKLNNLNENFRTIFGSNERLWLSFTVGMCLEILFFRFNKTEKKEWLFYILLERIL